MEHISSELKDDFSRWGIIIGDEPYYGKWMVGIKDVLRAHYLIIDYFSTEYGEGVGGVGPRSINLLHSALSRQFTGYENNNKWNSEFEICATLFYGIIKDHPFHDANKRTALLTLLYHLRKVGWTPDSKQKEFEVLAISIASNNLDVYPKYSKVKCKHDQDIYFIAEFLRRHTRKLDKNNYIITYQDLDTILQRYNFGLENPDGNKIEVVQYTEEARGFIKQEKIKLRRRIGVINFPGWKRQINVEDLKRVRKMTGLTTENGIDSKAFFRGSEPFSALIWQYQNLLIRLSDK